jgi:hypothetical protein
MEADPLPLRCDEKSAEVVDGKGVASPPLRKRVRNWLKIKGLDGYTTLRVF